MEFIFLMKIYKILQNGISKLILESISDKKFVCYPDVPFLSNEQTD